MKKSRTKEIMKVVAVTALSIGMMSATFLGVNRIALAAATNGTETLPPISAPVFEAAQTEDAKITTFSPPALTVVESPNQQYHTIPAYALSPEDVAQIGARYIWDVFGTCIDGEYVELFFAAHASQSNTWWVGNVDLDDRWYNFTINGITGERIDISVQPNGPVLSPEEIAAIEEMNSRATRIEHESGVEVVVSEVRHSRWVLLESGWFEMSLAEQMVLAGLSPEALEAYKQTAMELAQRHFDRSVVTDLQLYALGASSILITFMAPGETGIPIDVLHFTATDDTGREAKIFIPSTAARWNSIRISTHHNDFIPGFVYNRPGLG
ncbi:MAG: hypothetical protein FWB91_05415 [Defluviitaleaceae bacterium]|nr:hypothetical protein [Defluviitaleaceae bacterium]